MFKILLVILALALVGLNTLLDKWGFRDDSTAKVAHTKAAPPGIPPPPPQKQESMVHVAGASSGYSAPKAVIAPPAPGVIYRSSVEVESQAAGEGFFSGVSSGLGAKVTSYVAESAGLAIAALPAEGCQSVVDADKMQALKAALPPASQIYLDALTKKSPGLPVQLYSGSSGAGLCLPSMKMMLKLPG